MINYVLIFYRGLSFHYIFFSLCVMYLGNGKSKLQCFIDIVQIVFNMTTLVPGVMGRIWNETPDGIVYGIMYLLIAADLVIGLCRIIYLSQYAMQHCSTGSCHRLNYVIDYCSVSSSAFENIRAQTSR